MSDNLYAWVNVADRGHEIERSGNAAKPDQCRCRRAAHAGAGRHLSARRPLPSEAELAARFDVSRLTVREAIRSLASTNVIDVQQGKSSVINPADRWSPLDPRLLQARGQASGEHELLPAR